MQHYIDTNNQVHGIDEGQEFLIQDDWRLMTDAEVQAHLNPPKTQEQIKAEFERQIQAHLDDTAKSKGYDSMVSACSYAGYPNQFQAEAISMGTWRSEVWVGAYAILADVTAGTRAMPTIDEVLAELPVFGGI